MDKPERTHISKVETINLATAAGLPKPEQKQRGGVKPRFKNKWRNRPCPCGSGKKTKVCCGPRLAR